MAKTKSTKWDLSEQFKHSQNLLNYITYSAIFKRNIVIFPKEKNEKSSLRGKYLIEIYSHLLFVN